MSENRTINLFPFKTEDDPKVKLSTLVLLIIGVFILCLVCIIYFTPVDGTRAISTLHNEAVINYKDSSGFARSIEVIKHIQEEKKDYREFLIKISQMILLNLLLPVLTAVLGYKLGSKEE